MATMKRTLDARPDTVDFRDRMYIPTLVEVPPERPLKDHQKQGVPVLNQGSEGACTGFALATVAHFLLQTRGVKPDRTRVSPRMFYEMAKRYDEWKGEDYQGSSARAAMKGWHHHGVCREANWPYRASAVDRRLTDERAFDAAWRPLGAYFRVNHKDLVALHAALAEVGALYATGTVHEGWNSPQASGTIPVRGDLLGGHAFAMVGYDQQGFWIQNSWGKAWGKDGCARLTYEDWLSHGSDVWVARLGAPIAWPRQGGDGAARHGPSQLARGYDYQELRPHIITLGNDGRLEAGGTYGNTPEDVEEILREDFYRITHNWRRRRVLLYAHGGLVSEGDAIRRVADLRKTLLEHEVYPLAFVWKSDFVSTLKNILQDASRQRRPEGFWDDAKDFLLDRLDDTLEILARPLGGPLWSEMKENAELATMSAEGGARLVLREVARLVDSDPSIEVHLAGHSAGSILLGRAVQLLTSRGAVPWGPTGEPGLAQRVASCTLWAPACTTGFFDETFAPAARDGGIGRFSLYTLQDPQERDDHCANIYHKSLLYLVSRAFEPRYETPLLGMAAFAAKHAGWQRLVRSGRGEWVQSSIQGPGAVAASTARRHGDFDEDAPTLRSTLARIVGPRGSKAPFAVTRGDGTLRARRLQIAGSPYGLG